VYKGTFGIESIFVEVATAAAGVAATASSAFTDDTSKFPIRLNAIKLVARTLEHLVERAEMSLIDGNDFIEISLTLLDGDNENDEVCAMLASATTRTADLRPDILLSYLCLWESLTHLVCSTVAITCLLVMKCKVKCAKG
jgi:hypothetical protein